MQRCVPDWSFIHKELRRPGTSLEHLWIQHGKQMGFAQSFAEFSRCYRQWCLTLNLLMRQEQAAGAVSYTFCGQRSDSYLVVDTATGEVSPAFLFVAVLGASSYCYAEACLTDDLDNWIACHVRAF